MSGPDFRGDYKFTVPERTRVVLSLYNLLGKQILCRDLGVVEAGTARQVLSLNGYSSGTYIVRLAGMGMSSARKILFIK